VSTAILITATDTAGPAAKRVGAVLAPARLNRVIGESASREVRVHFRGLNSSRANQLGGRRTNFYTGAARGTNFKVVSDTEVVVSIVKLGIAQRYFGGTIKPRAGKKYLTIPARAEAHGKRASDFQNLVFVKFKSGAAALVQSHGQRGESGAHDLGAVMYWLKESVTQAPDPTVLPSDEVLGAAVQKDVNSVVNRAIGGSAGGTAP
jgi:hypothetical protein